MWEFFTSTLKAVFQKVTLSSILMALLVAIIVSAIAGESYGEVTQLWPPAFKPQVSHHVALPSFVVSFLLLVPVFYVLMLKEGDDFLTPLRNQLKGDWSVYYDDWEVDATGSVVLTEQNDVAKIGVNVTTKKLYIQSSLHNHAVLQDFVRKIDNISINAISQPMELIYYYNLSTKDRNGNEINGDIFVKMEIEFSEKGRPMKMRGKWHDLDKTFSLSKKASYEMLIGSQLDADFGTAGAIRYERL